MPVLPIASRVAPSGGIIQQVDRPDNLGATLSQAGGMIADTAGNIQRQMLAERERIEKIRRENQKLEDAGWADTAATELDLQKRQAFESLKISATPNDNFLDLWQKKEDELNQGALAMAGESRSRADLLSAKILDQRKAYGMKAIDQSVESMGKNAVFRHEQKVDANGRALVVAAPMDADKQLDTLAAGYAPESGDPNLALMPATEVAAKSAEDMRRFAKLTGENFIQNDPETLLRSLGGQRLVRKADAGESVMDANGNFVSSLTVQVADGKWNRQIEDTAAKVGLNPNLVAAVMQIESLGRPTDKTGKITTSEAGALGLMQLMPATAREMGVDPNDPEQNILGGARYLRKMLDQFGDPIKALAAYNSGPATVEKATKSAEAKARAEGREVGADDWRKEMRRFQKEKFFNETAGYLKQAERILGDTPDLAAGDLVDIPAEDLSMFKYLDPEDINDLRKRAAAEVAQRGRARRTSLRAQLANRLESERASYADGIANVDRPVQFSEFLAAGYDPVTAETEYAQHLNFRQMAPVIGSLKGMTKQQRDDLIRANEPSRANQTDVEYSAKVKAFSMLTEAAAKLDRQLAADAPGFAVRSNDTVAQSKKDYETLASVNAPPSEVAAAQDRYVANVAAFQRANGIVFPEILPKAEVDAIKATWYGQQDGPLRAAQAMSSLAQKWGKHYPNVLRQLAKDLPSEALWIGNLADDPGTEGVRSSMAAAAKMFADKDIPAMTGQSREAVAKDVRTQFADYIGALSTTDPRGGGAQVWGQLEEGAVKLAALKMATLKVDAATASKQAFEELVGGQSIFAKRTAMVGTGSGAHLMEHVIRIPKSWPGKGAEQEPDDILDGADTWLADELPKMEFQTSRAQNTFRADVKQHGVFVTSPNDDGLVLTLDGAPVRRKDGSIVAISWRNAANSHRPGVFSRAFQAVGDVFRSAVTTQRDAFIAGAQLGQQMTAPEPGAAAGGFF